MAEHQGSRLALICVSFILFCGMLFVNGAASIPGVAEIFYGSEEGANMENLEPYSIDINPAGWTFSVWGVIYLWQVVMWGYILSLLCRTGDDGEYVYVSPKGVFPAAFFICYIINNLTNASWLMIAAREWMHAGLGIITVMWICTLIPLVLSVWGLAKNTDLLRKLKLTQDIWLIRFIVHNGLGIYGGWMTVATLLNLGIVMVHWAGMDNAFACTILLGILAGEATLFIIMDFFVLHRYTNYLFTPYFIVVWALIGSLAKNYNPWVRNTIITVVLLAIMSIAALTKIVVMIIRHFRTRTNRTDQAEPMPEKVPVA